MSDRPVNREFAVERLARLLVRTHGVFAGSVAGNLVDLYDRPAEAAEQAFWRKVQRRIERFPYAMKLNPQPIEDDDLKIYW